MMTWLKEYYGTIAATRSRIDDLSAQEIGWKLPSPHESRMAEALCSPEKLIAMIKAGDPVMRLAMRTELQRMISRIDLDFAIDPDNITITVIFINDAKRMTEFRKQIRFTKPLHPSRKRERPVVLFSKAVHMNSISLVQ